MDLVSSLKLAYSIFQASSPIVSDLLELWYL